MNMENKNLNHILRKQENINIKFKNDINNVFYEIQESSIDISLRFHKNLYKVITENKKIANNIEEMKIKIKEQDSKIRDIYYYICVGILLIFFI
jgi:hypothetical protein